ncbi:MAG: hypothetical protein GX640_15880, partial [Fibrobacter sp.]|nr:hypothetical protein [Fibrobacter sp.]
NGYNPKTQEQVVGAGFSWSSQKNLDISLLIKYGDLSNECAIDKVARDKSSLSYALLQQYPLQASMLSTYAINDKFSIDFDLKLLNESIFRTTGQTIENMLRPVRDKSKINELNAAVKPAYRLGGNDTLGIVYNIRTDKYELFNDSDLITIQNRPSIFYTNNFQTNHISGTIRASGGTLSLKFADTADIKPFFYLGAEFLHNSNRYRIYAEKDDIPFIVNMDSIVYDQELLDSYIKAGCEFYKKWRFADLTLGYQFVYGVKDSSVIKSWPFYTAPYKQPGSVFIVGPSFGRWKGLALRTNFMISDIKPYLKASGALTYEIHPVSTREYIDIALAFTYWSEREDVLFAGLSGWNVPIYDLSLQIAAHIRSFRLFYKISNLLNRNNSYIPGYYSPGITFRWGFNWYIQR